MISFLFDKKIERNLSYNETMFLFIYLFFFITLQTFTSIMNILSNQIKENLSSFAFDNSFSFQSLLRKYFPPIENLPIYLTQSHFFLFISSH